MQGRDELAVKKTVSGLLKIIHPDGTVSDSELEELVAYALEGRRRVKEQMNKRKPDDEFALIDLSYFDTSGTERIGTAPKVATLPPPKTHAVARIGKSLNQKPEPISPASAQAVPAVHNGGCRLTE